MVCKLGGEVYQCASCPRSVHGDCTGHTQPALDAMMFVLPFARFSSSRSDFWPHSCRYVSMQDFLLRSTQLYQLFENYAGSWRSFIPVRPCSYTRLAHSVIYSYNTPCLYDQMSSLWRLSLRRLSRYWRDWGYWRCITRVPRTSVRQTSSSLLYVRLPLLPSPATLLQPDPDPLRSRYPVDAPIVWMSYELERVPIVLSGEPKKPLLPKKCKIWDYHKTRLGRSWPAFFYFVFNFLSL